ncbi:hypothetical protein CI238_13471 [Colletotrichum incanum]|uniref:Uncharacterized protein n=1 Tax=Colletotrichum incanum TaxID=1573173 RepID=A0A166WV57_COLIC|nr:hypothetical protein CI238_13471 [Colletotrichum incanum]
MDYNNTNVNIHNPPYLENVLKQLELTHSVTRLQFRLRSSEGIQFAVPFDFDVDKIPDGEARFTFECAESLAAASRFSLYFQHNVLKKESFAHYEKAISPSPTEALRKSYWDMRNVKRLYNGVGGKVHKPRGHDGPSPMRERCSSPASATTSCGSTLPFETDPRPEELPPPYEKCPSGGRSPTVRSDAAATAIPAKTRGLVPPRYSIIKQHDVLDPFQGGRHCGSEDTDIHRTAKRKRPPVAYGPEKTGRSEFDEESNVGQLELQCKQIELQRREIELQRWDIELRRREVELQRQIGQPQNNVEELQRRVGQLEKRHEELEEEYCTLQERQEQTDVNIGELSTDVIELQTGYEEVMKQMPDVCEEFENLKGGMGDTLKEDIHEFIKDRMAKQVGECVEAHVDEMKGKLCRALQ